MARNCRSVNTFIMGEIINLLSKRKNSVLHTRRDYSLSENCYKRKLFFNKISLTYKHEIVIVSSIFLRSYRSR